MPPVRSAAGLFSPLDEELALLPGEYSPLLHQRLVQTGTQAPSFARAAALFTTHTGTPASEATVRRYTERAGATLLKGERSAEAGVGEPPPRLYASVDGAMVPLVGGRWPETPSTRQWWAGELLHDLKHRGPDRLLRSLAGWAATGAGKPVGEAAEATLGYFESRKDLLDYPKLRAAGWPIGTGAIESANKLVGEERLKGPGMHWGEEHVNPMLALRNAQCSNRWDEAWARVQLSDKEAGHTAVGMIP